MKRVAPDRCAQFLHRNADPTQTESKIIFKFSMQKADFCIALERAMIARTMRSDQPHAERFTQGLQNEESSSTSSWGKSGHRQRLDVASSPSKRVCAVNIALD